LCCGAAAACPCCCCPAGPPCGLPPAADPGLTGPASRCKCGSASARAIHWLHLLCSILRMKRVRGKKPAMYHARMCSAVKGPCSLPAGSWYSHPLSAAAARQRQVLQLSNLLLAPGSRCLHGKHCHAWCQMTTRSGSQASRHAYQAGNPMTHHVQGRCIHAQAEPAVAAPPDSL
jgi:hypothetical protein